MFRSAAQWLRSGRIFFKEFLLDHSDSGCLKLLARLGFEYRKPKSLRRVAAAEQQAEFIDMCERLLKRMRADEAVYFAEPVHAEYQTKPAYGWVKAGCSLAVTTTEGRGGVNIRRIAASTCSNYRHIVSPEPDKRIMRRNAAIRDPLSPLSHVKAVRHCDPQVFPRNYSERV